MSVYVRKPENAAKACIIWLHGLGADAQDMMGLAAQLRLQEPVQHVFMDAPIRPITINNGASMRGWYDIMGFELTGPKDQAGIEQSEKEIRVVLEAQVAAGFAYDHIFLAGFSQGGVMALVTGLQTPQPLAGIVALSAYLPLASNWRVDQGRQIPIFLGAGKQDPLVLPLYTKLCLEHLRSQNFQAITSKEYTMEHAVCMEEIADLTDWFTIQLAAIGGKHDGR